jgi:hypothetical protein
MKRPGKCRYLGTIAAALVLFATISCGDAMDSEAPKGAQVTLSLVTGSATPMPNESITFSADVIYSSYLPLRYDWTVTDPDGKFLQLTKLDALGKQVSFTVIKPGTHIVLCQVTLEGQGGVLSDTTKIHVDDPNYIKLTYTARIMPPPFTGLPPVDRLVNIGGVDMSQNLQLEQGQQVSLKVTGAAGTAPAMVRLLRLAGDPLPRDIYLPTGSAKVRLTGTFHALVIPDAKDAAPMLLPGKIAAALGSSWEITLDPGKLIQGKVLKSDATPMAGATVSIHTKSNGVQVPSTLATTASDGTFAVRVSTGPATMSVVPPASEGLPVASIQNAGLMIVSDATGWVFSFAGAVSAKVGGVVTLSDGSKPASGVHAVMTAKGLPSAGTLTVGGATLKADGVVRKVLTTDASGALKDPLSGSKQISMPAGTYTVDLWPGGTGTGQGFASTSVQINATSQAPLALSLSERVTISGAVKGPEGESVLARVVATSTSGQFTTTSDTSGAFSMNVDDKTTYNLMVRPLGTEQRLSRHDEAMSVAGPKSMPAITLTRAIAVTGRVLSANTGIPGATVRIWCSAGGCPSNAVVDEVQTAANGGFELLVPPSPLATP